MTTEHDQADHSADAAGSVQEAPAPEPTALEVLTGLVLDAADAANDSAQSATEAISQLRSAVESNRVAAAAVGTAPAIFGAVTLGIGVIMAVMVAIFMTRVGRETDVLQAAVNNQAAQLKQVEAALKQLADFQGSLTEFKTVAADTTQRAMVMLREQVKADRLALQQLEVRRLEEMIGTARSSTQARPDATDRSLQKVEAKLDELAGSKGLQRLDAKLDELGRAVARAAAQPASANKTPEMSKEAKALQDQLTQLRADIASLKSELLRSQEAALQQKPGVPTFRKSP